MAGSSWCHFLFNTLGRWLSKTLLTIDERGSKSLDTVFSIAICRQLGDKLQSKTPLLAIFDLRSSIVLTFPIAAYPVCLTKIQMHMLGRHFSL